MFHLDTASDLIAGLFCICVLTPVTASAAEAFGKERSSQPRVIEAAVHNVAAPGWQQVQRVSVICGTNGFDFVAPEGLRLSAEAERLTLAASNSAYILTFRILNATTAEPSQETPNFQWTQLLEKFPNARLIEQSSRTVANQTGTAFELRLSAGNGSEQTAWVAFIPSAAGLLEFSCHAQVSKSSEAKVAFNSLLRTFRNSQNGKLKLLPICPQDS